MIHPAIREFGSVLTAFESAQTAAVPAVWSPNPFFTAVGSVAEKALLRTLLRDSLEAVGVTSYRSAPSADLAQLIGRDDWSLALVLSPYKMDAPRVCGILTSVANDTGVVDTIVRDRDGVMYGVNTNAFGLAHAVRLLMAGVRPNKALILGTGATSRCAIVGLRQQFGQDIPLGIRGRNLNHTVELAKSFGITAVEDFESFSPDLVLNCTTVGESADIPMTLPVESVLIPGCRFFDLNNRTSELQAMALGRGCVVLSGILMQLTVNALRAHLVSRRE